LTTEKRSKIDATRRVYWAENFQNLQPPTRRAYSIPPDQLAKFQDKRKGERAGRIERKGREREELPLSPPPPQN